MSKYNLFILLFEMGVSITFNRLFICCWILILKREKWNFPGSGPVLSLLPVTGFVTFLCFYIFYYFFFISSKGKILKNKIILRDFQEFSGLWSVLVPASGDRIYHLSPHFLLQKRSWCVKIAQTSEQQNIRFGIYSYLYLYLYLYLYFICICIHTFCFKRDHDV